MRWVYDKLDPRIKGKHADTNKFTIGVDWCAYKFTINSQILPASVLLFVITGPLMVIMDSYSVMCLEIYAVLELLFVI